MNKAIPVLFFLMFGVQSFSQEISKDSCYSVNNKDTTWKNTCAEVLAEFQGGDAELFNFFRNNVNYPKLSRDEGVQGKVYIGFIIEKDGSITDVKIYKGVVAPKDKDPKRQEILDQAAQLINEEAIRVVKLMPKWTPAMENGKPVRVRYTVPLNFRLG